MDVRMKKEALIAALEAQRQALADEDNLDAIARLLLGDASAIAREVTERALDGTLDESAVPDHYVVSGWGLTHLVGELLGALLVMQSMSRNLGESAEVLANLAEHLGDPRAINAAAVLRQNAAARSAAVARVVSLYPEITTGELARMYELVIYGAGAHPKENPQ